MLTRLDLTNYFVTNLERERYRLQLTQEQMARKLEMGTSTYKKLILGGTQKVDLYTAYLLYRMNESTVLKMIGYPDELGEIVAELRTLSKTQLRTIRRTIAVEKDFLQKHPAINPEDFVPLLMPVRDQAWVRLLASVRERPMKG